MGTRLTKPMQAVTHLRASTERAAVADTQGLELAVELAHDIRSPLGALITLAELLQTDACGPVTEAQARLLKSIERAARGLGRLTEDVVESGRVGALDTRTRAAPFSITELVESVREIAQPMADTAGLSLRVHYHAPPQWVGSRGAIARVLVNLVTNALKYTERGGVEFGARIVAVDRMEFFVSDSGDGFHARPGARPRPSGSGADRWRSASAGLGLAICRRLVHAMGTTLEVESRPGQGTRFHFVVALPDQS